MKLKNIGDLVTEIVSNETFPEVNRNYQTIEAYPYHLYIHCDEVFSAGINYVKLYLTTWKDRHSVGKDYKWLYIYPIIQTYTMTHITDRRVILSLFFRTEFDRDLVCLMLCDV